MNHQIQLLINISVDIQKLIQGYLLSKEAQNKK